MKHRPQLVSFTAFVNIVRFLVSATFIFSGFVKAIDPKGTAYKLDAYLSAFGFPDWADDGKTLAAGQHGVVHALYPLAGFNQSCKRLRLFR